MGGGFSVTLESHKDPGPGDDIQGFKGECVVLFHWLTNT